MQTDGKYEVALTVENLTKDLTGLEALAYNAVKGDTGKWLRSRQMLSMLRTTSVTYHAG